MISEERMQNWEEGLRAQAAGEGLRAWHVLLPECIAEIRKLTSELERVKRQLARAMAIIKIFGDAVDAAKALESPPQEAE